MVIEDNSELSAEQIEDTKRSEEMSEETEYWQHERSRNGDAEADPNDL